MPYCDEVSREVELDYLKTERKMLESAFREKDKAAPAKRELLKLKQSDHEFPPYYAEFQRYVANVKWNKDGQMDAL
jgi:hypothetical protein